MKALDSVVVAVNELPGAGKRIKSIAVHDGVADVVEGRYVARLRGGGG